MNTLLEDLGIDMREVRRCPDCGEQEVRVAEEAKHFQQARDSVVWLTVTIPVWTCAACKCAYTDGRGDAIEQEAVRDFLRRRLSPQEVRSIRKSFGLSRAKFARLTGYGEKTIKRWEDGKLMQNASADRFLRLLDCEKVGWQLVRLCSHIEAAKR